LILAYLVCGVKRIVPGGLRRGGGEQKMLTSERKNADGGRKRGKCDATS
jgi:hypothetical protein